MQWNLNAEKADVLPRPAKPGSFAGQFSKQRKHDADPGGDQENIGESNEGQGKEWGTGDSREEENMSDEEEARRTFKLNGKYKTWQILVYRGGR